MSHSLPEIRTEGEGAPRTTVDAGRCLVVYNDDENTFDHVIDVLMDVCDHSYVQAEQCTLIIHYRGKCTVKRGPYARLRGMSRAINRQGISAAVE